MAKKSERYSIHLTFADGSNPYVRFNMTHFFKSPEISARFASTEAYSELFMKLASNADEATRFVNGIIPQVPEDMQKASDLKKAMIPGV